MDILGRFSLFAIAVGLFLLSFQVGGMAHRLEKINRSVLYLNSSLTSQTAQHSYLAKTYMKPVLPPCWDYLSDSCVTCGSERAYWNLDDKNE